MRSPRPCAELALHERLGVTTIYVTHDQVEASRLPAVAVMRDGASAGRRSAESVQGARELFVAAFIGSPSMNLVEATVADEAAELVRLLHPNGAPSSKARSSSASAPSLRTGLRRSGISADRGAGVGARRARRGRSRHLPIDASRFGAEELEAAADEPIEGLIADDRVSSMRGSIPGRGRVGQPLRLATNPRHFHFFDPDGCDAPCRPPSSSRGTAARRRSREGFAQGRDGSCEAALARGTISCSMERAPS